VMMLVIFNKFASGLSLYYLCYNVLTAVQQKFINHQLHKENEEAKEASGPRGMKTKHPPRQKKKSLTTNGRAKARPAKKSRR
ncbi:MAG: hypothetical protein O6942_09765, partial [Bacteroidetes bacterium]|nr:hypothetical protein [Bacteroidota bacterium]